MDRFGLGKTNWLAVLIILALFSAAYFFSLIQRIDRFVYDIAVSQFNNRAYEKISIISIDDESIATIGQWPWSRNIHADLVKRFVASPPRVLVYLPYFFDASLSQENSQLLQIGRMFEAIGVDLESDSNDSKPWQSLTRESKFLPENRRKEYISDVQNLYSQLLNIRKSIVIDDQDKNLAEAFGQLPKVILPSALTLSRNKPAESKAIPDIVTRSVSSISASDQSLVQNIYTSSDISLPITEIASNIDFLGHANVILEADGVLRRETLVINYHDNFIPSLPLAVAAANYGIGPKDIVIEPGFGVNLGGQFISTNTKLQINTAYYNRSEERKTIFPVYSFADVLNGKVKSDIFSDKIVIVGETARGLGSRFLLPDNRTLSSSEILAHSISNIINDDFIKEPHWNVLVQAFAFFAVILLIVLFVSRYKAYQATFVLVVSLIFFLSFQLLSLYLKNIWVNLAGPISLMIFSYIVFTISRYFRLETVQQKSSIESNENHRILGLTYQSQGQLDLAFDHLRRCDQSEDIASLLHMLGLDFERKRLYHKAAVVYEYITSFLAGFKDVEKRLNAIKLSDTSSFIDTPQNTLQTQTIVKDDQVELEKPTLGRYTLNKEIGRGGMGIVYLGVDPKINRSVALKTLDLNKVAKESNNPDEVIARFYREAKAVGQLSHRNIVTIYDVGQEDDLAYLAMEFLEGTALNRFVSNQKRLPIIEVIKIGLACADALEYAHKNNVIHRDIKPSNIMYDQTSRSTKITDFGVAHLVNNQFTQTNIIVGTLGYMSPEQIKGETIDGRTDIFSLGATLYQLLSGSLAFDGSSIASFSYSVCHDAVTPINELEPQVSEPLNACILKSLEKNPDDRYQSGHEMKDQLALCLGVYKD